MNNEDIKKTILCFPNKIYKAKLFHLTQNKTAHARRKHCE